ncbi:NAD(P)H-dependent oxidoreductase (plasmid) [Priestia megaterium]|uniref:NADPH-dependent FMN reductase family protein n=1 Tax=Priestia megaterium (strain ATCC 14581 / DSM 32 / CCUG 1817 / JCM 2506 / NBRC 15308 / NCIMB 9376 / NCTC 10342 / NRRL B-14308 / VKM B-512 / Ford 19) TaxID=1348623 RepID=A0A0B6B0M8_PRIM2|nr:NAD(P)H-dependent oxidoreductase [Priestia megaterium]AJI25729.1 NADPH-dependent FMN reductase family protein [Priestia megaterium NBRC 15308 = ATCC 14581]KFN07545.1 NADPH-dependent FMN reductase family protein [Priestia megaterium]KGJ82764.1 NADPH-dependent FMN reductase [Priestia megaterium NBRC 15308 = ATCC 14581]MDR4229743.1 NAD(P)H-dependent oxidoreductase [Priestia megaterium]MED4399187.1 NAD(P)H-dependent oxidoreductase [Priestia megaterium]
MKNILLYSGSRNPLSRTNQIINELKIHINQFYPDFKLELFDPISKPLLHSTGCKNCFNNGFCPSDALENDYGEELKRYLEKADLIIFATPVYSHNVSSDAKIFIDRLSYWGHILKLVCKPVITIVTAESNGGDLVEDYLYKVFSFMGATIVNSEVFLNQDPEEHILSVNSLKESIKLLNDSDFKVEINEKHEATFQTLKSIIRAYPEDNFEYRYWLENGLFDSETLNDYINKTTVY